MSFKIVGAHNGWLIRTGDGRDICFFAEENGPQEGLVKALHYVNCRINNSKQQFERLQRLN